MLKLFHLHSRKYNDINVTHNNIDKLLLCVLKYLSFTYLFYVQRNLCIRIMCKTIVKVNK